MSSHHTTDALWPLFDQFQFEATVAGEFSARGDYAVDIGDYAGVKLHQALVGSYWLRIEGDNQAHHIRQGDCVLLTNGRNARFSNTPHAQSATTLEALSRHAQDGVMTINGGGEYLGIGMHMLLEAGHHQLRTGHLPPVIHVRTPYGRANTLSDNVQRFRAEYAQSGPGRTLALRHLAAMILLDVLRHHLGSRSRKILHLPVLGHTGLARAVDAIHDDICRAWSLASLCKIARMSRASFAFKFKNEVGISPLQYVTYSRIHVACELLEDGRYQVAEVSSIVGFRSQSAFSAAFRQLVGCRPGLYKKIASRSV
jgi:AraC-like DNA-binding protein